MPFQIAQMDVRRSPSEWSYKAVSWKRVFVGQDWITLLFTVGVVIGLVVADQVQPTTIRPFLEYDATVSYPHR